MNKIDITKIAVKFDVENTTEELFDAVVNKFVELGYGGSAEDVSFDDLRHWNILLVDDDGDMLLAKSYWSGRSGLYEIIPPEEFLALGSVPADNNTIIVEWLNKLEYIFLKDVSVGSILDTSAGGVYLTTDHGDIRGPKEIVEFINTNYEMLKISENTQKKADLEAKRQKLMDELSEIDQQLGLYK